MIYIDIHGHRMRFDESVDGIKKMFQYFPALEAVVLPANDIIEAIDLALEYLNNHHMEAWVDRDDLKKSPPEVDEGYFSNVNVNKREFATHSKTYKLKNNLYHHVFQDEGDREVGHVLSTDANPGKVDKYIAKISGNEVTFAGKKYHNGAMPFQIESSAVHEKLFGRGFGKKLYEAVLGHHGHIISDAHLSPGSNRVYTEHFDSMPHVHVELAPENDPYQYHEVRVTNPEEYNNEIYDTLKKSDGSRYESYWSNRIFDTENEAKEAFVRNIHHSNKQFGAVFGHSDPNEELKHIKIVPHRGKFKIKSAIPVKKERKQHSYNTDKDLISEQKHKWTSNIGMPMDSVFSSATIPVHEIHPTESVNQDKVASIMQHIKDGGELPPILLDGGYGVLDGHHRLEAAKKLKIKNVPVVFLHNPDEDDIPHLQKTKETTRTHFSWKNAKDYIDQAHNEGAKISTNKLGILPDKSLTIYGHTMQSPANGKPVYHHIISNENSTIHTLSLSENPREYPISYMHVEHYKNYPDWKGVSTVKLSYSGENAGFGLGSLLYKQALKHHGKLQSDNITSKGADKVWKKLLSMPKIKGKLGIAGDSDSRHMAELEKASFHRKHPYNPKHDIKPGEFEPLRVWANVGAADERTKIKPLPENAKARLLHKLSGQTEVKIVDGKRHFLLHRGMSEREMNNYHKGDVIDYTNAEPSLRTNSWTSDHRIAYQFGGGRVASAWVHEDDIINSPIMHWDVSKRLKGEKEYIVRHTKPHTAVDSDEGFRLSLPHSSYKKGETSVKVFDKDNYLVEQEMANIHHKINQRLKKGVPQKKYPFDPKEIPFETRKPTEMWTSGYFDTQRHEVPKMTGNALLRGIHKLHRRTKVRRNPQTGEKEFQLFRGMTPADFAKGGVSGISSFTSDPNIAHAFNGDTLENIKEIPDLVPHHSGILSDMSRQKRDSFVKKHYGRVIESWVPESAIHSIPSAIGSAARDVDLEPVLGDRPGKHMRHKEHEVIVNYDKIPEQNKTIHEYDDFKSKFLTPRSSIQSRLAAKRAKLSKAFSYKGTIRPEHSDPDGMKHPEKPYIKGITKHGPAWFYNQDIIRQHEQKFMHNYNKFVPSMTQRGQKLMHALGRHVASDPDRHAIPTGTAGGGQELRLRHLNAAMSNTPGYSIKEDQNGLIITAERHSGDKEKAGELHTWHFDGKNLKFLPKIPISKSNGGIYELGRINGRAKETGGKYSNPGRGHGRGGQTDLNKSLPQIKAPGLLPANQRPEQDVYRVAQGTSAQAAAKRLKPAYGSKSKSIIREITKDPQSGVHDPYKTKISVVSERAPEGIIAHEAHHRTVSKLVDTYGLDKVHKLYSNIINQIPKPLLSFFDNILTNSQNYVHLRNSGDLRQNLAYKEEMINLIRDVATGNDRRKQLKDFYQKYNNYASVPGLEQWEKLDHSVKNTWKNIVNFANSVKKEHL